jgi:hypothetical protein
MRSLRLGVALMLGLCLAGACSNQDTGLLDLTLNADSTNPPPQAVAVDLIGSGGIHRSYPGKFPPDGAASLRLEYPDLPTGTITFTVQTLDSKGCVLGESPAPFEIAIKAGARVTAAVTIQKSTKPCADGGGQVQGPDAGVDAGHVAEAGAGDGGSALADGPFDIAADVDGVADPPAIDSASADAPSPDTKSPDQSLDMPSVDASATVDADSFRALDTMVSSPDVPIPTGPTIVSFVASPATISAGSSATLTAIFRNATGSSIDHGIGSVTSGNGVGTGALSATTTYKLTITDAAGASASQTVTVTVVPLPSITSFTAFLPTIAVGTLTQLTGTFAGGTGVIDHNIGTVTSGTGVPTGVLTANTTFTLTVTNAAGDSVTKQTAVAVSSAVGTGVFTATGSMTVPRSNHTATLLPNGKILIAGGSTDTRAELYDPTSGTFAITGSMGVWRAQHTATLLPTGRVLIVGGTNDRSAEIYDPVTGIFSATGAANNARATHTATLLQSGRVLVAGGFGTTIDEPGYLASAEVYNPTTGAFATTGNLGTPRSYATANLLLNGKVLIAGGDYVWKTSVSPYLAGAELYDSVAGTFGSTGSMMVGRAAQTSVTLLTGSVLVVGGPSDAGVTTSCELYDPTRGTFAISDSVTDGRYRHTTTLLPNGWALVAGGDLGNDALSSAEIYDPGTGRFSSAGAMTTPRELHAATLLQNGMVLIVGGGSQSAGSASVSAELYY